MTHHERMKKIHDAEAGISRGRFPDDMSFEHGSRIALNMLRTGKNYKTPLKGFSEHYGLPLPESKLEAISLIETVKAFSDNLNGVCLRGL